MHNVTQWTKAIQVCHRSGAQCECCAIDLYLSLVKIRAILILFSLLARGGYDELSWTTARLYMITGLLLMSSLADYRNIVHDLKALSWALTGVVSTRCTYCVAWRVDRNFNIVSRTHKKSLTYILLLFLNKQYQDDLQLMYVSVEWNMSKR